MTSSTAPDHDTCFVIGAGVCMRSWEAVCKAVSEVLALMGADCGEIKRDLANYALAQHVYEMRLAFTDFARHDERQREEHVAHRADYLVLDRVLKERIAEKLVEATRNGDILMDPRFLEGVRRSVQRGPVAVFTTNWDLVLESCFQPGRDPSKVQHLHGRVDEPSRLYLPTETSEEAYRTREDREHFGTMLSTFWQYAARARRVWIYGLSLDPGDAEVARLLSAGLNEEPRVPREVVVSVPTGRRWIASPPGPSSSSSSPSSRRG